MIVLRSWSHCKALKWQTAKIVCLAQRIFFISYVTVANMRMANIAFETTIKIIIEEELICHEKEKKKTVQ